MVLEKYLLWLVQGASSESGILDGSTLGNFLCLGKERGHLDLSLEEIFLVNVYISI